MNTKGNSIKNKTYENDIKLQLINKSNFDFLKITKNTERNKKIKKEIEKLHKQSIFYGKKLEESHRLKKQLQGYYKEISKETENDTNNIEKKKIKMQKELKSFKKDLEKITKNYNSISSANIKKRNKINSLRKERTLYDHIFKTLEYQILTEEKNLLQLIKKNQKEEELLKSHNKNLENIKDLVGKNKYEDFYKILQEEKKKYNEQVTKPQKEQQKEYRKTVLLERKKIRNIVQKKKEIKTDENSQKVKKLNSEDEEEIINQIRIDEFMDDKENKLEFLEKLFKDFKFYTENTDVELLKEYLYKGEEINERIYNEFCDLENNYENLKITNKKIESDLKNYEQGNKNNVKKKKEEDLNEKNDKIEEEINIMMDDLEEICDIFNFISKSCSITKKIELPSKDEKTTKLEISKKIDQNNILESAQQIENEINILYLENNKEKIDDMILENNMNLSIFSEEEKIIDENIDKKICNINNISNLVMKFNMKGRKDELIMSNIMEIKDFTKNEIRRCFKMEREDGNKENNGDGGFN